MRRRKTAGELSLKVSSDRTKYDNLEVGHALTDDVIEQLHICAQKHDSIFNEDEYCLMLIIASDPLIHNVRRHKYAAFLYLPSPRPQQSVFLYNKNTQKIKRLWSLPDAKVMAVMANMSSVAKQWHNTKLWIDAFYHGWEQKGDKFINTTPSYFFELIRKQNNITLLSESEYLNAHREELIKAGCKDVGPISADPFDFSKITINKIIDTKTAVCE